MLLKILFILLVCTNAAVEKKSYEKRSYTISTKDNEWHFHLISPYYDNFYHIPGVKWHYGWLESMPMKSGFKVPSEYGPNVEIELEKMGYIEEQN